MIVPTLKRAIQALEEMGFYDACMCLIPLWMDMLGRTKTSGRQAPRSSIG